MAKKWRCPTCGKELSSKQMLNSHIDRQVCAKVLLKLIPKTKIILKTRSGLFNENLAIKYYEKIFKNLVL